MGGTLIGLGGMALLMSRAFQAQVESEIQAQLSTRASLVNSELARIETLAKTLATSVATLHVQGAESVSTYKRLTFELFKQRPEAVIGLGFGQDAYGVLKKQQWFFPFYYIPTDPAEALGQRLAPPHEQVYYTDETVPGDFYPETWYWKDYMLQKRPVWSDPEPWGGLAGASFYTPIFDDRQRWLGGVNLDFNATSFNQFVRGTVARDAGFFAILSKSGLVVAYPTAPRIAQNLENFKTIPGLESVWSNMQEGSSGAIAANGRYWAYERIPSTDWIAVAAVPYAAVFALPTLVTVASALAAGLLVAIAVWLFVRQLNRRLQPILNECYTLAATDAATQTQMQREDEIGRLSLAFFNLLHQQATNEARIRDEAARTMQAQEQLVQQATQIEQESTALQTDVNHLLEVVSAVESGDLTVQAEVTDRITGLVADTLNRLVESLAGVITAVHFAIQRVTQGASELEPLAVSTAQQAQHQARSVRDMEGFMQTISDLAQETARQAVAADAAVLQTRTAVTMGQREMTAMAISIVTLQQGTQQIVQRSQTLTDYVELAAQFARAQQRWVAAMRVLALNTSTVAARASGQPDPSQFASIAREVETIAQQVNNLAAQSSQSLTTLKQRTHQIQTVASGLNDDVQNVSERVDLLTASVSTSGQAFDRIYATTGQMVQVEQEVTQSSQAIAAAVQTALQSVQSIATVAMTTEQKAQLTREQAAAMGQVARQLSELVQFFHFHADQSPASSSSSSPRRPLPLSRGMDRFS
jgi:twitching motility protein PilJ